MRASMHLYYGIFYIIREAFLTLLPNLILKKIFFYKGILYVYEFVPSGYIFLLDTDASCIHDYVSCFL
jgi:hypothetical protein